MNTNSINSAFIKRLCLAAGDSKAANHPYLDALANGSLPNMQMAIQDFAFQYGWYSKDFVKYLNAVISCLSQESHRVILRENLAEENGHTHDIELPAEVAASIQGVPHSLLYERFQDSIGVDANYKSSSAPSATASHWSEQLLNLCQMNQYVGVGAIGIGTEFIVSKIYKKILNCLQRHSSLSATERVFFDLHSECDDEHAEQLLEITEALAKDSSSREQIEYGVREAFHLREMFWDCMLERAQNMPAPTSSVIERFSVV